MTTNVGEVSIKLSFDSKQLQTDQAKIQTQVEKGWSKTGAAIANVASGVVMKAFNMMTNSISSAVDRIDTLNQFPKVLQNFGISADEAAEATERIRDSVLGLPTSLDDAISGVQKLFMVTNNLKESEALFSAVNDAAIVFANGSSEAISNFIYGYSQSLASGKILAQEFNQMNEAIPGIMAKIAESMGMNVAEMKEGLSEGSISIDQFNKAFKKLDTEGSDSMGALSDAAFEASGGISTAVSLMQSAIDRALSAIISAIGVANIQGALSTIGDAFEVVGDVISGVITFVQDNSDWIVPILVGIATALGVVEAKIIAVNVATKVMAAAQAIWTAINTAIRAYRAGLTLSTAIQAGFNAVMNANPIFLLVTVLAAVTAALIWFFTQTETGKQIIQSFGEALGAVFNWVGETFSNLGVWIGDICSAIGNAFSSVGDWAKGVFQGIWDFVTGIFSSLASFFQGIWSNIIGIFTTVGVTVGEAVSGAFKSTINGMLSFIEGFVNKPINILNGFVDVINGAFGAVGVNLSHIDGLSLPRMAQGGLVSSATTAIIGEAGQEAVLPLERNTGNWSGLLADTLLDAMAERGGISETGGIIVNQTNYINNEMDADDIGRRMMTSIRRAAL